MIDNGITCVCVCVYHVGFFCNLPDVGSGNSPVISMCSSKNLCSVTLVGKSLTPWYGIRCSARHSGHFT